MIVLLRIFLVAILTITLRIGGGKSLVLATRGVGIDAESCLIAILRIWLGGDDILRVERNVDV